MVNAVTPFTFFAHRSAVTSTTASGDATVKLSVDASEKVTLAPFLLLDPDTRLKVTIDIDE